MLNQFNNFTSNSFIYLFKNNILQIKSIYKYIQPNKIYSLIYSQQPLEHKHINQHYLPNIQQLDKNDDIQQYMILDINLNKITQILYDKSTKALTDMLLKLKPHVIINKNNNRILNWLLLKDQDVRQNMLENKRKYLLSQLDKINQDIYLIKKRQLYSYSCGNNNKYAENQYDQQKYSQFGRINQRTQKNTQQKSKSMQALLKKSMQKIQQITRKDSERHQRISNEIQRRHKKLHTDSTQLHKRNLLDRLRQKNGSTQSIKRQKINPQQYENSSLQKKLKQYEIKKYPKSTFLIKIQQQQKKKKNKDNMRYDQKKKVKQRQINYWRNIMKNLKNRRFCYQ